jgi:hypothetical protein
MKKTIIMRLAIILLILGTFASTGNAQKYYLTTFNQGNWEVAEESITGEARCHCGSAAYNCLCELSSYSVQSPGRETATIVGQINIVVSSHVISGNILNVTFKEKIKMKLKTDDFIQTRVVSLDSVSAHSLGYESITIQPGKYTIRGGKNLALNVKLGNRRKTDTLGGWK